MLKHLRRSDTVHKNASNDIDNDNEYDEITRAKKLLNGKKRVKIDVPVKIKVEQPNHNISTILRKVTSKSITSSTTFDNSNSEYSSIIKTENNNDEEKENANALLLHTSLVKREASVEDKMSHKKLCIVTLEKLAGETGAGTFKNPYVLPLRTIANKSNCFFCHTDTCVCEWMSMELERCYAALSIKRQTEVYHKREWCAKSILPPFVSRLVQLSQLQPTEAFYDFGCGNGSVLFQVALMTGAKCVGIEINEKNALVAKEAWKKLQPRLEAYAGKTLHVEIVCADFCKLLHDKNYFGSSSCVIWASNLLLPKSVNQFLAERFRKLPPHSRVFCLEDLYPHSRDVAKIRDPEAFELFEMTDYR